MIAFMMKVLMKFDTSRRNEVSPNKINLVLFYRTYPALRVGSQTWAPRWQGQAFHAFPQPATPGNRDTKFRRHPATADLDEQQNVARDERSPGQHFDCPSRKLHLGEIRDRQRYERLSAFRCCRI